MGFGAFLEPRGDELGMTSAIIIASAFDDIKLVVATVPTTVLLFSVHPRSSP